VLGAGPVGLLGAMALVNAGFEAHVYSREPESSAAQAIGAAYHSSVAESIEDVARRIGNIDLVYEATGASQFAFEVLRSLGANGIFVFTGVPGRHDQVNLDTDTIMRNLVLKNQVVLGTVNAGRDAFEAAIADLGAFYARWPAAVRSLITGRYPIEAFHDLLYGHPGGIKNIISLE
jgi:threonine dehydrogenase-like Zn-dependent dehydrogenase